MNPALELPESIFWQYSIVFYARPGVAAACLALQDREKADVNLILLAFWLASRRPPPGARSPVAGWHGGRGNGSCLSWRLSARFVDN